MNDEIFIIFLNYVLNKIIWNLIVKSMLHKTLQHYTIIEVTFYNYRYWVGKIQFYYLKNKYDIFEKKSTF